MENCARKNSLMAKVADTKSGNTRLSSWHVRRELIKRAICLAILYGVAQHFGLREWTSALLQGAASSPAERVGCMTYLFLYGSFIFLVPILAIATLLLTIWEALGCMITGMLNYHAGRKL